jgi:polyhydroxyalkanoate synthase
MLALIDTMRQIQGDSLEWLYRENRLCAGTPRIGDRIPGALALRVPLLAVSNRENAIAPPRLIVPFIDAMPYRNPRAKPAWALQHLAILVGRQAHATVWPDIISWLHGHA